MASENAPVIFPARLPEGTPRPHQHRSASPQSIAAQLVQTIAATLGAPDALPRLTEILGMQLATDACLLLSFHRPSKSLFYTFWQTGEAVQWWTLSEKYACPRAELQCRVIQGLIHHGIAPSNEPDTLPWQEGIETLLTDEGQTLDWLPHIRACHALPITAAPDTEGVVLLLHRSTKPPRILDQAQLLEVTSLVAISVHQHYLHHQAQHSNEQLNYLNYLKEDFLSTLNHELRTPLTSMMLAIRMLRRPDLTPERAAMYLNILEQQCSREINLVNDLLMLQSVNSKQPKFSIETIDLVSVLTTVVEREQGQLTRAQLKLQLDLPENAVIMATSQDYLNRVLQELLTNACKYAAPRSTITLRLVDQLATRHSIKLCVTNTGSGIHPEEIPYIFEKFRRGQDATKNAVPGTGTGLALAKELLEQLGSTIAVSSQPLTRHRWQTCFTVELPTYNETAKCS